MKTVKQLINATDDKRIGSHSVVVGGRITKYIYHDTAICVTDNIEEVFYVDDGGYKTSSTTRAINAYRKELEELGYTEIDKEDF